MKILKKTQTNHNHLDNWAQFLNNFDKVEKKNVFDRFDKVIYT